MSAYDPPPRHGAHLVDVASAPGGGVPQVETSTRFSPEAGRYLTDAQAVVAAATLANGWSRTEQSVRATVAGFDRRGALAELERVLQVFLAAVQCAKNATPEMDSSRSCNCHNCCTLSCCNPPIAPALIPPVG
jgi:hypothetical protein